MLTLYIRPACHLCTEAIELLQQAQLWSVRLMDIDQDLELAALYGLRIPVLANAHGAELDWPFDLVQLQEFAKR